MSSMRVCAPCAAAAIFICAAVLTAGSQAPPASGADQQPVFQAGVDVLSVDVQVVDRQGHPLRGLDASSFQASVGGKKRRVISAEFVETGRQAIAAPTTAAVAAPASAAPAPAATPSDAPPFFLVIDCLSFEPIHSQAVIRTARNFVSSLAPGERVGLFAYPLGPKVEATTDHAAVLAALAQVNGQNYPPPGYTSEDRPSPHDIVDATDPHGARMGDAYRVALQEESQNTASLGMLRDFMHALRALPGRKVVVLVSSGLISSDRPGFRPDLTERGIDIGHEAAAANATIYSLFVDQTFLGYGAGRSRLNPGDRIGRDAEILNRYLDQVSGASGGAMLTSLTDDGAAAFTRILDETSGYYLLGIEAADTDRDGRPHALSVKSSAHDATVRARSWIMIPR